MDEKLIPGFTMLVQLHTDYKLKLFDVWMVAVSMHTHPFQHITFWKTQEAALEFGVPGAIAELQRRAAINYFLGSSNSL